MGTLKAQRAQKQQTLTDLQQKLREYQKREHDNEMAAQGATTDKDREDDRPGEVKTLRLSLDPDRINFAASMPGDGETSEELPLDIATPTAATATISTIPKTSPKTANKLLRKANA